MAGTVCKVLGVLFVLIGLIVIVRGAPEDQYHNGLHFVTGMIALGFGFAGSVAGARAYCLGFGAFYVAFGLLGMIAGDPAMSYTWHVGPMHLDMGDHLFHVVLGPLLLASGFFTKRRL